MGLIDEEEVPAVDDNASELERDVVGELLALSQGRGILHRIPTKKLMLVLEGKPDAYRAMFDLSDPECPVIVRRCRARRGGMECGRKLTYPCAGGVPLLGLQFVMLGGTCRECDEAAENAADLAKLHDERGKRLQDSGIPSGLLEVARWDMLVDTGRTPEETEQRKAAIEAARAWARAKNPKPRGLFLYNRGVGTGKTMLAATAAVARTEHSPIRWVSVAVLVAKLEMGWSDDERQRALKVLTGKTALVLDDVDKIPPQGKARQAILAAIEQRTQHEAPFIVTTNLGPKQLEEHFGGVGGEATVSRLAAGAARMPYPGPDMRIELPAAKA